MNDRKLIYDYDDVMETRKWIFDTPIPFIQFPEDWKIQIIPPFGGATIRFRIKKYDKEISVYLDCYDNLGCCGEPYWEIYPYKDDTYRCVMNDIDDLLKRIEIALEN